MFTSQLPKLSLSRSAELVLSEAKSVRFFNSTEELVEAAVPIDQLDDDGYYTVGYDVEDQFVPEVKVCRVKNGVSANYLEPYMRRRDSECMVIADDRATDKMTYKKRFGGDFEDARLGLFLFQRRTNRKGFAGGRHLSCQRWVLRTWTCDVAGHHSAGRDRG
jgi:hypothetical protein